MKMAYLAASRSTCIRRAVGAVAVKNNQALATGYNGAPRGCKHCDEIGCLRQKMQIPSGERHEICRAVHAEQNVIAQASKHGVSLDGATLYITATPCVICAKMIINTGIREIYCASYYPDNLSLELLNEAGVKIHVIGNGGEEL